jgi:hypothetical protein
MPIPRALPPHLRPRREKVFGDGRPRPLDRNSKARIMHTARALMHRTEKGKHYGKLTAKYVAVLEALLWCFHNAHSGLCFPSYATIAERARCTSWPELTEMLFITHKEISEVSENPLSRLSVISLIPTGYFG